MIRDLSSIARERRALGLSQKELAKMAGVSQSLISKVERGQMVPSYEVALRIFEALERARRKRGCTKASEVMSSPVIHVTPEETVSRAISIMGERGISQLPVMTGGRVVGSVTEEGLLRKLSSLSPESRVEEVLEEAFPILPADASLPLLRDMLFLYPAVLIQERGRIVGIVTKSDLLKGLGREC
ncbi:MAG: CBS domain-containing protein [Candidatus Korarchaeota archaeon]|nr:CBS domain-containing protein [Candidatus Korarchaeota archaeon]